MRKPSFVRFILLAAIAVALISDATAQTQAAAMAMVRSLNLGSNLASMTYRVSKLTQTQQGVALRLGPAKADELLRSQIAAVVPKFQNQWDANLAEAWAPLMSEEEFKSVAEKRQESPYARKFSSLHDQAGAAMRAKSESLLTQVVTEVMNGVLEKASETK